jgi:predicted ATPase
MPHVLLKTTNSRYHQQIFSARQWPVVLYDTADERGCLIDGASALLHLVRRRLSMNL